MFVLVVDDLRLFGDTHQDLIIHYATSSGEALKFLEENFGMVSEIWLDHDLGGDDTVMPVVDWLDEKALNGEAYHITKMRVLTSNPVGYNKIMLALSRHFPLGTSIKPKGIREQNGPV